MEENKVIVYRKVLCENGFYLEFLFVPFQNCLVLPTKLPAKYEKRVFCSKPFKSLTTYKVLSKCNPCALMLSKSSILEGEGIWLLADDCKPKGAIEDIDNKTQFMSITLKDCDIIQRFDQSFQSIPVYSLYHGTNRKNIESILKNGLEETYGMLGMGVYLGTFWKACRFACFSQTYEKQDGCIFRLIAQGKRIKYFPELKGCDCCKNILADHCSTWRLDGYDGACALPTKSDDIGRDGKNKYLLRNEEWILKKNLLQITHFAFINTKDYHYNPLERNIEIS